MFSLICLLQNLETYCAFYTKFLDLGGKRLTALTAFLYGTLVFWRLLTV